MESADGGQVAAPAGRAVDLVRASQWIKRRNAPPQRSCLNRGAVAHHRLARAASAAPLARARGIGAIKTNAAPPSTQLFEPGCCRTPPPSSRRQRRAPRARARGIGAIKTNAVPLATERAGMPVNDRTLYVELWFKAMPRCSRRNSPLRVRLRTSMGSRRRSTPSSSSRSKAQSDTVSSRRR